MGVDAGAVEIMLCFPLLCKDQKVPCVFVWSMQALVQAAGVSRTTLSLSEKTASWSMRSGPFSSQWEDSWEGSVACLLEGVPGVHTTPGLVGLQHQINWACYLTPIMLVLQRWRQEDQKYEFIFGVMWRVQGQPGYWKPVINKQASKQTNKHINFSRPIGLACACNLSI